MWLSRPNSRDKVADVCRQLLEQAYPQQPSAWIDHQVRLAEQRINQAVPGIAEVRSRSPGGPLTMWRSRARQVGDLAAWLWSGHARRVKVLTCRVRADPTGIVVARIANTGTCAIGPDDYLAPLRLRFPGRTVAGVQVPQSTPECLAERVCAGLGTGAGPDRVLLPTVVLAPGESFTLVTTLSGAQPGQGTEVAVDGRLREGWIRTSAQR